MDSPLRMYRYKLILFGNMGVGKTSLIERFVNDKFEEDYQSTMGYNVYEKRVIYNGTVISLMIFDVGGQEKFRRLRHFYARGANAAFIVYDLTDPASFTNVIVWKNDLHEFAGEIPFIIIGNKLDLNNRQVKKEEGLTLCSLLGAHAYYETSAKTGIGVEDAFYQIAVMTYVGYTSGTISA